MSSEIVEQAEKLHSEHKFADIFQLLSEGNTNHPKNVEILWRFARAHYDMAEISTDKNHKKDYITKGLDVAKSALDADGNHWAAHKWYAIMLSTVGEYIATKDKIANAFKIKEHLTKAIELKPGDPTTLHALGRWCFTVASIGWMERTVAATIFASPPTSSYEEALKYFEEAQKIDPNFIRNASCIGDCYANLKKQDEAQKWYKTAAALPPKTDLDKTFIEEAKKKIK